MAAAPKFKTATDQPDKLPKDLRKILDRWLSEIDTTKLICRDAGHWWPADFQSGETYGVTKEGNYAREHPCTRGCGVRRTRFVGRRTGWLDKGSTYNYAGAKNYLVPSELGAYALGREVRGLQRLELKRRADEGEIVVLDADDPAVNS